MRDVEMLARRAYELHRVRDVIRGRSPAPIPTWEQLPQHERARLTATMLKVQAEYYRGRVDPREVYD